MEGRINEVEIERWYRGREERGKYGREVGIEKNGRERESGRERERWYRAGMGNWRPAGRMRPATRGHAARGPHAHSART